MNAELLVYFSHLRSGTVFKTFPTSASSAYKANAAITPPTMITTSVLIIYVPSSSSILSHRINLAHSIHPGPPPYHQHQVRTPNAEQTIMHISLVSNLSSKLPRHRQPTHHPGSWTHPLPPRPLPYSVRRAPTRRPLRSVADMHEM